MTAIAGAARALLFGFMALVVGACVFRAWILGREPGDAGLMERLARFGAAAASGLVPALLLGFAAQFVAFHQPGTPAGDDAALLLSLGWGRIWQLQMLVALMLIAAFLLGRTGNRFGWGSAGVLATFLAFTPALGGHAAAVEGPRALAVMADGVHVLAAGAWIGTLAVLAFVSARGGSGALLLSRIRAFSPLALASAAVIVATGTIGAWLHLHHVSELWTSAYGRLLALKLALFCGVLVIGAWNWKRATPRLAMSGDGGAVRRSIAWELAFAAAVVAVTAWFVATAPPEG